MADRMGRYVTDAGYAVAVVRAPATLQVIGRDQHALADGPMAVLGEAILGSLLLATRLKGPGLLSLTMHTEGVFNHLRCDAIGLGSVRAMVLPTTSERLQAWNGVDALLGPGMLTVSRQLRDEDQPYQSKLLIGDDRPARICNDYLVASEQVPAAIGVDLAIDGDAITATALYLERLPGGEEEHPLMQHLLQLRDAPDDLAKHRHDDDLALLHALCPEATFRELHAYDVGFHCPCSRERYVANLRNFSKEQLSELTNGAGVIETVCDFCRSRYAIPLDDVI